MKRLRSTLETTVLVAALLCAATPAAANTANVAYSAMGLKPQDVLTGSVLSTRVLPGNDKQLVAMVTYFTGKKDQANAVNVRLEVFDQSGSRLTSVYSRDFGRDNGGFVGQGELEIVDLDGDGVNEIIVSYDDLAEPLIRQRQGEVIVREPREFRTAWSGAMKYDATQAARKLPEERRDRYTREVDVPETLRTRGATLVMTKKMIAVAGERLAEPKVVKEAFPLRSTETQ